MFTDNDYRDYFGELENIFKKTLVIYTDLLNELSDQSMRNKLSVLAAENMENFRFAKTEKENILQAVKKEAA